MSHPTFFVPIAFAHPRAAETADAVLAPQEPKSTPDTPSGGPAGGPTGPQGDVKVDPNAPQGQPQSPCANDSILWVMPVFLALMYFMMIRPEQRRRKEQQTLLASIKQGDKVVTVSGMHGLVRSLTEKTVTLRVDSVDITFDRSAVARIERGDTAGAKAGS